MCFKGRLALLALAAGLAFARPALARVLKSFEDALAGIAPGASFERRTLFLDEAASAKAAELAGVKVKPGVVHAYRLLRDGQPAGIAYLDVHRVRTLPEKVLVVVGTDGKIAGIEVLAFQEPPDYLPPQRWYDKLKGRALDPDLQIGRGVDGITGATLTTRAAVESARRALALHQTSGEGKKTE